MSKRRLSKQQIRRIRENRENTQIQVDEENLGDIEEGLVIAHYGQQLDIEQQHSCERFRCFARSNLPSIATGDQVLWRPSLQNDTGIVEALQPRKTVIERPHPYRGVKPIAANVDWLVIVIAPKPEPHANLIDRYLVAAEYAKLKPILVVNKLDLIDSLETFMQPLDIYRSLGYPVLTVSAHQSTGLEQLETMLASGNSVFVGQSGVGKSSLLNSLLPHVDAKVGALSHAKAKGKHTTTTSHLYHLPKGGHIIDSPGIREFGLWHLEADNLAQGFIEFLPHLGYCKFRDCAHTHEKGCAILEALEQGSISQQRLDSYFSILEQLKEHNNSF